MKPPPTASPLAGPARTRVPAEIPASIDSRLLFTHGKTVQIEHSGQCYTLRITRENKLILTK